MDLLTHVIFAYLLSFVIWGPHNPQYIAAGALAGGLPDADALLFPLSRRFPLFQHRAITHSVLGITITSAAGSWLLPELLPAYFPRASELDYFLAMLIGGLSHTCLDGFTNFEVYPLVPFSWRPLHLDADRAINFAMMTITVVTFVALAEERGVVPYSTWLDTVWALIAVYGGYLLLRVICRWRAEVYRKKGGYTAVSPTTNPLGWTLIEEKTTPEIYHLRWRPLLLGRGASSADREVNVRKPAPLPGPVASAQEALDRSYQPAMAASRFLARSYHFGQALRIDGGFEVKWYSIEFEMFGRCPGVKVFVDGATGAAQAKSAFLRLRDLKIA